ncbi:amidase family protein [Stenotrophomonas maltophilia]
MESGEHTNAFLSKGDIRTTLAGTLSGVTFSVKDNIDVAGLVSSYGSPDWPSEHPAALHNAVCVDLALAAGARYVGKVVADEFTYSLEGQNQFFGTPLNPKAPDRIPGGSSSGSAASVATGSCDFSLGTDSGGSIRVPASFCGVWEYGHPFTECPKQEFSPSCRASVQSGSSPAGLMC